MKYKHSLRFRITISFFLFGTLLMIGVAVGVHMAIEDIESRLVEENLQMEFDDFKRRYHHSPDQHLPGSATVTSYLVNSMSDKRLPTYVRHLQSGTHEIDLGDKVMQVIVGAVDDKFLVLTLDATLFEQREDSIAIALIVSVISASLLALWLGYALSQRVIAPVSNLAHTVATLSPDKPGTILSNSYADDEVGELALVFERYLSRLSDFVSREQEFTSNASHELRTPLTVIKGAIELMNTDPGLNDHSRRVLRRLERASEAMSQTVETLLVLARENGTPGEQRCRLADVVHEAIDESRDMLESKPIKIMARINHDFEIAVPHAVVAIVLNNLLRNAITHTSEGEVTVSLERNQLCVADTGIGIKNEDLPHIFERHFRSQSVHAQGSGIGLAIVKRICDRYHWSIDVDSQTGQGTRVCIMFNNHNQSG